MILTHISQTLVELGLQVQYAGKVSYAVLVAFIIAISIIANIITKKIILRVATWYIRNNRFTWDNVMLDRKVFQRLSHLVPAVIIYIFINMFPESFQEPLNRGVKIYVIFIAVITLHAFLDAINDIYNTFQIAKTRPIKSYIQVSKIFITVIGFVLMIAGIMGKSPSILLGGIGALSAVLMLVFKDSILGLVGGVQLSTNDMVRVGDWIEMPRYGADGDVIDISLNTVKVQNFDRTITTIPTYALVSDSFKNWRGMQEAGGRRMMRAINIDIASIKFCDSEMLDTYKKIFHLTEYIECRQKEIDEYNKEFGADPSIPVNGRRMTNIGVFRRYIANYLKNHPKIHNEMIQIVRQLAPAENGLPLQIYVFINDTNWGNYEEVQADIFDHILAVAPCFKLRIFQNPTGYDFQTGFTK
ncbi:MAG: mechanosensitive ion channel [Spirochaetes bacterium]|jgi:miniconductance mechanosensitive channel|nr:mechanosensitive ion channel [Spirochaetota bacterium]